ncbi:MAG: hypothetical protein FWH17_00635 [Oscillospiraceae bacterium]|nr:hypothetical protein [Oscillospiraceae bacterium]
MKGTTIRIAALLLMLIGVFVTVSIAYELPPDDGGDDLIVSNLNDVQDDLQDLENVKANACHTLSEDDFLSLYLEEMLYEFYQNEKVSYIFYTELELNDCSHTQEWAPWLDEFFSSDPDNYYNQIIPNEGEQIKYCVEIDLGDFDYVPKSLTVI